MHRQCLFYTAESTLQALYIALFFQLSGFMLNYTTVFIISHIFLTQSLGKDLFIHFYFVLAFIYLSYHIG